MEPMLVEENIERAKFKSIIESLLFAWAEPLSLYKIAKILELKPQTVEQLLEEMKCEYKTHQRGLQIVEANKHYQFSTLKENYIYVEQLCATSKSKGLSNSALEVLAIIAYKQPITKLDMEQIRGVNSEGPLQNLIERELVEVKGKLEKIGRPQIYGTTDIFLKSFGFRTLSDLPEIEAFSGFKEINSDLIGDKNDTDSAVER
ncbi:SMC-Scp complex subunit ScpB [Fusibacter bizertensis]